jgi:hypothetical protein
LKISRTYSDQLKKDGCVLDLDSGYDKEEILLIDDLLCIFLLQFAQSKE